MTNVAEPTPSWRIFYDAVLIDLDSHAIEHKLVVEPVFIDELHPPTRVHIQFQGIIDTSALAEESPLHPTLLLSSTATDSTVVLHTDRGDLHITGTPLAFRDDQGATISAEELKQAADAWADSWEDNRKVRVAATLFSQGATKRGLDLLEPLVEQQHIGAMAASGAIHVLNGSINDGNSLLRRASLLGDPLATKLTGCETSDEVRQTLVDWALTTE